MINNKILIQIIERCISLMLSGIVLLLLITWLIGINFNPIMYIIELDTLIYQYITPPQVISEERAKRIIFVDIDDGSICRLKDYVPGMKTPRSLQASLLGKVKDASAAVVFMDFDYRECGSGDEDMRAALLKAGCPVIIPRMIVPTREQESESTAPQKRLFLGLPTIFDSLVDSHRIHVGHPNFRHTFELVNGVTATFKAKQISANEPHILPAAAVLAHNLVYGANLHNNPGLNSAEESKQELFQFRVGPKDIIYGEAKNPRYIRVIASALMTNKVDMSSFKDAIVVIGASHLGADDIQETITGQMPGALVHVNLLLQLQSGRLATHGALDGFFADLIFILVQAIMIGTLSYAFDTLSDKIYILINERSIYLSKLLFVLTKLIQIVVVLTSPIIFSIILYKIFLNFIFHVNVHAILLPLILSASESFFEGKKLFSDKIAKILVNSKVPLK
ncbi:MAG TPA: hypothetical protein DDZ34_04730 [Syntrophaceae bacterium]|nr:hypothetical protein [Syntrophaceae bacterium]